LNVCRIFLSILIHYLLLISAINDYKSALDIDNNYRRAKEGHQRAEKLLKQSKKRDYYKILGVKR
jgi:DnaJ family protein C protein 3